MKDIGKVNKILYFYSKIFDNYDLLRIYRDYLTGAYSPDCPVYEVIQKNKGTKMRRKDREIKDIRELELIISQSDVCRVAFADNNLPYIVTMNFGYSGGDNPAFYFHCAREGKKLEMMKKNNFVCFELDTGHELYKGENSCDWGMRYSSVVGYGKISVMEEREARIHGLDCIMSHYSKSKGFSYDEKALGNTAILRLDIEEMTGKRKS